MENKMSEEEIRAEFARRRTRLTKTALGFAGIALAVGFAAIGSVKLTDIRWFGLPIVLVGWGLLVFLGNRHIDTFWTCPVCGQPLQRSLDFKKTCPRCGVKLR